MRAILLLLLAIAFLAGCFRSPPSAPAGEVLAPVRVQLVPVQRYRGPALVDLAGTVRPIERALIAAKISGPIDSLPVALGQVVKRGDLLVHLAAPEYVARLAQSRARLEQAEREAKRSGELAAAGADSVEVARAAAERLRAALADVAEAEAMLTCTSIRAPYDGNVAQKFAHSGDFASPGQSLLLLESSGALQVEAAVPASLAAGLSPGTVVQVNVADVATPFRCAITEIAAAADSATHTVLVRLALPSTAAPLSGRAARLEFAGPTAEALFVPANAVMRFGQMERLFVVAGGCAQLRLVKSGGLRGDSLEILAGVSADENVVIPAPGTLRDGQSVIIAP